MSVTAPPVRPARRVRWTLVALALLASLLAVPAASAAPAERAAPRPVVTVDGALTISLQARTTDLDRLGATELTTTYTAGGVPETHTFRGPLLVDVLTALGPVTDPAARNGTLRLAVLVIATDGYQAVLSWGEIDRGFAGTPVLLATSQDGERLTRPRLVVPDDTRGGRYVSDVTTVTVVDLGA